ncbi:unnamed protein product [Ostreobium quekettii]|uniref:Uncharacterized protein n=1 Tax=Ostreobium quekettii TaxID=121088 RepID=A0A8S1JB40_9CHLO|nr:unnamed protein product [Ostreobium quekettii]|eukprot:evm.model.scf_512.2 EVM.evm.TU.scf_512.2   scf_512:55765-69224(-)
MRIMIKGGVWKNTEDEILKAAVMKYGINQWARISSLLTRKSAKQCKARWYEWLDPSIKKTEWTKEEDEKLLHLAKLFPTQWRTVAPLVGRTPAQCLERYEKLLDLALAKDEKYDPSDDPRRLRPGEIDPNPEAKPARPDPVDMDEDEKEMLSEARARLANTRGKKAKRKAREKQLEEARRFASLQKKRELKAAGIELRGKERRRGGINYNKEVAFEKQPPPGFYDVAQEQEVTKQVSREFRPVTLQEVEGKRRKDVEEALLKADLRNQKLQASHDQPAAIAKVAELNDPLLTHRRRKLMLPAPQISEQELQQIAKMGGDSRVENDLMEGAGGEATKQLLGQYEQTPMGLATPMRTPRTPAAGGDHIMQEAHNLAKLRSAETPLLGGQTPELYPSDFSGITPRQNAVATPNPLATPLGATPSHGSGGLATPSIGGTPLTTSVASGAGGPMQTPVRDELGLNTSNHLATPTNRKEEKAQKMLVRNQLRAQLAQLPAPVNRVEIVVPDLPQEEPEAQEMEVDAVDRDKQRKLAEQERLEKELRSRSQVIQQGLPRPLAVLIPHEIGALPDMSLKDRAEHMLSAEVTAMLQRDEAKYPVKEGKKKKPDKKRSRAQMEGPQMEEFDEEDLLNSAALLEAEALYLKKEMGHAPAPEEERIQAWAAAERELIWLPSKAQYGRGASAATTDRIDSLRGDLENVHAEMLNKAKRASKLEDKIRVLCSGHWARDEALRVQLDSLWHELEEEKVSLESFKALHRREQLSIQSRLQAMKELVMEQQGREAKLQERYKELCSKRDAMLESLQDGE